MSLNNCVNELGIDALEHLFVMGCKEKSEQKIGLEYERLLVQKGTFKSINYDGKYGVCEFLREFAKVDNWDYLLDDKDIIGLKKLHNTITLEPGCQLELSLEPKNKIQEIKDKINNLNSIMNPILDKFGMTTLNYGISPVSTYKDIKIIPKRRYDAMANYFWGILSDVMMRETAGIQVCLDFTDEADAIKKFRIANMLSPFMTAMFANSPIRGGVETGYKSFRSLAWLNTDNDRCGFAGKFTRDFGFKEYIAYVINSPMIFIQRNNEVIKINKRLSFKDFMKEGYEGHCASVDDFKLHANLYFPDVRLRKFIEIRNQDCVNRDMQYSILAIYKGLFYNENALDTMDNILSRFSFNDISELRHQVPKWALETKIQKYSVKEIAKEIIEVSEVALKEFGEGEEKFLEPIMEFTNQGVSPADIILLNWNGLWNKDIRRLIKYLSF